MQKRDVDVLSDTVLLEGTLSPREGDSFWASIRPEVAVWIFRVISKMGLRRKERLTFGSGASLPGRAAGTGGVKRTLLRDRALAEDCEAEAGCEFLLAAREGKVDRAHSRGFLFRIVQRTAWRLATARAERLMAEVSSMPDGRASLDLVAAWDADPERAEALRRELLALRKGLDRLPPADRELILEVGDGAAYAELVPAYGPSQEAVRIRVFRIRGSLRRAVAEEAEGGKRGNRAKKPKRKTAA